MTYKIFTPIYLTLTILTYLVRGLIFFLIGYSAINPMAMAFNPLAGVLGALQEKGLLCFIISTIILVLIYSILCIITWKRGVENNYSSRLFLYPFVAGLFDIFFLVPFVPTIMLLMGFFIGTREYIED
ncbi:MAG: hypothetical protein E7013_04080 [Alphaproteobacteria bacterium]|nr:hypothetical protein [Alphaproteobacteria bacterium]